MRCLIGVLALVASTLAISCDDCLNSGQVWCPNQSSCIQSTASCSGKITKHLDCPTQPNPAYAYNETFARKYITTFLAAESAPDPNICFKNQSPYTSLYKDVVVTCDPAGPKTTCHGYTAWDPVNKAIIVAFEGTVGGTQMTEEILSFIALGNKKFFEVGYVYAYFYDAFLYLWNGGIQKDLKALKYQYPDYELWITGHSLGASIASITASYIVQTGMHDPLKIKLVTFGQPRTGDYDYAAWQTKTIPYSYRIVHRKDPIPHVPPQVPISQKKHDELYHHKYEVWYNNDMTVGQPYVICPEADGPHCSNTQLETDGDDHVVYFARNLGDWGAAGCPN